MAEERMTPEQVERYWTEQAKTHKTSPGASWSDHPVIALEARAIAKWIRPGDRVLDIGCANGFTTLNLAKATGASFRGLDYIPEMIRQAEAARGALPDEVQARVSFSVGNILQLPQDEDGYDRAVVIRVLINLGDWATQRKALDACARVLRPGGMLLLSEATLQGWRRMNAFREEWGLAPIPMPAFNCYLDEDRVTEAVSNKFRVLEVDNFASTYFVATRVLKPLLASLLGKEGQVADPGAEWNRWAAQLPAHGDYGTQKLFILERMPD